MERKSFCLLDLSHEDLGKIIEDEELVDELGQIPSSSDNSLSVLADFFMLQDFIGPDSMYEIDERNKEEAIKAWTVELPEDIVARIENIQKGK